jgi:hypothetical protein
MPAPRQEPLGLHALDPDLEDDVLVTGMSDPALRGLAGHERLALQVHAEPAAELLGVGQRPPHACARRLEQDFAFDPIGRL